MVDLKDLPGLNVSAYMERKLKSTAQPGWPLPATLGCELTPPPDTESSTHVPLRERFEAFRLPATPSQASFASTSSAHVPLRERFETQRPLPTRSAPSLAGDSSEDPPLRSRFATRAHPPQPVVPQAPSSGGSSTSVDPDFDPHARIRLDGQVAVDTFRRDGRSPELTVQSPPVPPRWMKVPGTRDVERPVRSRIDDVPLSLSSSAHLPASSSDRRLNDSEVNALLQQVVDSGDDESRRTARDQGRTFD